MHDDDIVCYCREVTVKTIRHAIHEGARTVEAITDITDAGLECGTCIEHLETLLED